jgi:dTMP kinase
MRGTLIVFEGGDGSGKSSQMLALASVLRDERYDVVTTREPGGTPIAEEIRSLIVHTSTHSDEAVSSLAETLLLMAGRELHAHNVIKSALADGMIVLCDRFDGSTFAYQYANAGLYEKEAVFKLFTLARELIVEPLKPRYVWLDMDPEIALARAERSSDHEKNDFELKKTMAFHKNVREGYKMFFEEYGCDAKVDATQKKHHVQSSIHKVVKKVLRESILPEPA